MNSVDAITVLSILSLPWFWVVCQLRSRQTANLGKSEASEAWKANAKTAFSLAGMAFVFLMIARFLVMPSLGNYSWVFQGFAGLVAVGSCALAVYAFVGSRKQVHVEKRA
jgi:hypothetical protein